MAVHTISHEADITRTVEKQMRNWEIARCQQPELEPHEQVADFITIANVPGAGGNEVAVALGNRLEWPVYDRELLTNMARDDEARATLYHSMDERDLGWLEVTLRCLIESGFRKHDYFHRLIESVLCLARQGPAIFVGRSADLILPKAKGVRVKLIASREYCARNFAQRNEVSLDRARAEVMRIENERRDFILNHFRLTDADADRFDLLINMERFTTAQVLDLIVQARREKQRTES